MADKLAADTADDDSALAAFDSIPSVTAAPATGTTATGSAGDSKSGASNLSRPVVMYRKPPKPKARERAAAAAAAAAESGGGGGGGAHPHTSLDELCIKIRIPASLLDALATFLSSQLDRAWTIAVQRQLIQLTAAAAVATSSPNAGTGAEWLPFHVRRSRAAFGAHLSTSTLLKNIVLVAGTSVTVQVPNAPPPATAAGKNNSKDGGGGGTAGSLLHRSASALVQVLMALPETQCLKRVLTTKVSVDGFIDFIIIQLPKKLQPFIDALNNSNTTLIANAVAPPPTAAAPAAQRSPPALAAATDASFAPPASSGVGSYSFRPIGYLRSCFVEKYGTPRQPSLCPNTRARLTLCNGLNGEAFEGLDEYSHVWVLFVCHQNTAVRRKKVKGVEAPELDDSNSSGSDADDTTDDSKQQTIHFKNAKVAPPRAGGKKVGVFATRSPHRPNPIALSVVRLVGVDLATKTIELSCIDLIDGTPILDIKPYHPSDCVAGYSVPNWVATAYASASPLPPPVTTTASAGSAAATSASGPVLPLRVSWTTAALSQLEAIIDSNRVTAANNAASDSKQKASAAAAVARPLLFYRELSDIRSCIEQVIGADPRSLHNKTAHLRGRGIYGVCIDRLDVAFRITTPTAAPLAAADAASKSGATAIVECAEVLQILYYADGDVRPRMRTAQWLTSMESRFPTAERAPAGMVAAAVLASTKK